MALSVNSFCDLCCQPVRKGRRTRTFSSKMNLPGSHGLPSVLNEHLVVYFVVKKLLELEDEQFFELMSGDVDMGRGYPSCFCQKCEDVVIEAFELHTKVVDLHRNIKKLGERLKELLKLSWKGSDNVKSSSSLKGKEIAWKLRKLIDNEDLTDDTCVKTEDNPMQAEPFNEEQCNEDDFLEADSFMDSFSNKQSDPENDSILPDPDSDKEEETIPCKRRTKRINPSDDEEDKGTVSDDSDYEPEEEALEATSFKVGTGNKRKSAKRKKGSSSRYHGTSSVGKDCHLCGMVQKCPKGFRSHMSVHKESTEVYGNKYDCPKCKYPTISENKLRFHMTKAHQETRNNTCSVCGFVGSRRHIYDKHMLEKHGIEVWTPLDDPKQKEPDIYKTSPFGKLCNICGMVQKCPKGFRNHMSVHEESSKKYGNKYDCPKCKYPTISEAKLRLHMNKAHQQTYKNTCSICGFVGSRRWIYDKHMLDKHDIQVWTPTDDSKEKKTGAYTSSQLGKMCKICGMLQKCPNGFRRHLKAHKESTEVHGNKYDCPKCKYPAISEAKLRYHMTKAHRVTNNNTCSICGYVGPRRHHYEKHMLDKHGIQAWTPIDDTTEKSSATDEGECKMSRNDRSVMLQCEHCSAFYKTIGAFERHQNAHKVSLELNSKFDCDLCGFPSISAKTLKNHKRRAHPHHSKQISSKKLPLTCPVCQKTFSWPHILKVHMIVHQKHDQSFDIITGLFSCNLCDFKGKTLRGLEMHIVGAHRFANISREAWKLSQDSYICSQCGRSFLNTNTLRKHVRIIHEGKYTNRYRCKVCGNGFEAKGFLESHMKTHNPT